MEASESTDVRRETGPESEAGREEVRSAMERECCGRRWEPYADAG